MAGAIPAIADLDLDFSLEDSLLKSLPYPACIVSYHGGFDKIVYVNKKFDALLSHGSNTFIGKSFIVEFLHQKDHMDFSEMINASIDSKLIDHDEHICLQSLATKRRREGEQAYH